MAAVPSAGTRVLPPPCDVLHMGGRGGPGDGFRHEHGGDPEIIEPAELSGVHARLDVGRDPPEQRLGQPRPGMSSRKRISRGMRKLLAADMSYRPGALCDNYRTGADPCPSLVPVPVTGIATARTCSAVGAMSCASRPCSCAAATISASVPRADQPQSHKICLIIEHHRKGRGLRSGCDADISLARPRCRGRLRHGPGREPVRTVRCHARAPPVS
jgi:hypothetical protein